MTSKEQYYASNGKVFCKPQIASKDGKEVITALGFVVCEASDILDDPEGAAETIAQALNLSNRLESQPSSHQPHNIPSGTIEMNGKAYMTDAKGSLVPKDLVRAQDQLQDETVRKIIGYGKAISGQVARFKVHTYTDIADFEAILAQEYETTLGGAKGNKTLMTYDGLFKVQVQVSEELSFGPELQIAKKLVDECLIEWSAESRPELGAIVTRAFNTDKEGQINRHEIVRLTKLEITDERWQRGMQAIKDAMRTVGSKSYVRCYERPTNDARWQAITIDLAKA